MDELYDFIWDVTLLEYIVSMHAKRGEFSRKRIALDIITQVEININNNEEILREARATRRSAFMRYLCSVFL
jgi:integrator complex subunit 8